jgi:hypothetical protein
MRARERSLLPGRLLRIQLIVCTLNSDLRKARLAGDLPGRDRCAGRRVSVRVIWCELIYDYTDTASLRLHD